MFHIRHNVPRWERLLRLALGALLVAAAASGMLTGPAVLLAAAGAAGLALTGVIGFCPACALLGRKPANDTR